jgi:hypothetical protein
MYRPVASTIEFYGTNPLFYKQVFFNGREVTTTSNSYGYMNINTQSYSVTVNRLYYVLADLKLPHYVSGAEFYSGD